MKKFVLKRDTPSENRPENYRIAYNDLLNEQQHEAVMHQDGPALVIAGAGSGKTRTLTYRVARLIEHGVPPQHILLLTFTRRAAREMMERATSLLDERCSKINGGTFHFYCNRLLHQYAEAIGYPENFTLLDASDATDVIDILRSDTDIPKQGKRFPRKGTIYSMISTAANKQQSLHQVIDEQYSQFIHHIDAIEEIARRYQMYKKQNHVMDFDDLLVEACNLLRENRELRLKIATSNRYILVDEYQDTNALQAELIHLLSDGHNNVMAVGDDAQSIYAFRGANHRNILNFPKEFDNTRIIKLEENYRSTQNILNLANAVIRQAKEKFEKNLFTNREEGELPGLVRAPDERDQSRFIAQMILNKREEEVDLGEIAVLFRNGRDSYDLELELNRKKIPFVKYGGQKFAEAAHIKDVLSHVKVIVNPSDTLSWNRILLLLEGIGPKSARDIVEALSRQNEKFEFGGIKGVSEKARSSLMGLGTLLMDLKQKDFTVSEAINHIVNYYKPICEKRFDDHPKRLKDLEAFVSLSQNFRSFDHMLEDLALDPIEASAMETEPGQKDENPLVLSTIHSSKGLEWQTVFLIQCLDGIIPSGFSLEDEDQIDEELRLLYVACTRAGDELYITYPLLQQSARGDYFSNPSRFVQNLDDKLLEPWELVEESQQQLPETDEPKRLEE